MCEPVDSRTAVRPRLPVDVFDQHSAYSLAPQTGRYEKILKVAVIAGGPAGAMLDEMNEANRCRVTPGECSAHGLCRIEQACPSHSGNRRGDVGLVKGLIAPPQRHPRIVLFIAQGGNRDRQMRGHTSSL